MPDKENDKVFLLHFIISNKFLIFVRVRLLRLGIGLYGKLTNFGVNNTQNVMENF